MFDINWKKLIIKEVWWKEPKVTFSSTIQFYEHFQKLHSMKTRSSSMSAKLNSLLLPEGVGSSLTISASSSCWYGASRMVSTRCTVSRWNLKLFLMARPTQENFHCFINANFILKNLRRKSSMNVWEPTFGTRLKMTIWFSARRVLFNDKAFSVLIWMWVMKWKTISGG